MFPFDASFMVFFDCRIVYVYVGNLSLSLALSHSSKNIYL